MKKVFKFGIIGTSCAGKTTLAHGLVARLKEYGILADGLFSQDRKFSFSKEFIETEEAQNWMVANLIAKEVDTVLHGDIDVFITDRTPVDLFAYYAYQYNTPLSAACWEYAKQWCARYDALYYLEPLPFQDDGKRPSDDFRLGVDAELNRLLLEVPKVKRLTRHEVLNDVLDTIGFMKPNVKIDLTEDDFQALANQTRTPIVVKERANRALADYDLWALVSPEDIRNNVNLRAGFRQFARGLFGRFVEFDLELCTGLETFDFVYTVYHPSSK